MRRISPNNPVRRCLFPAEDDEARVDNFVNILQESSTRDKMEKMKKWNFDFENEVPLEGAYKWYRVDESNEWLGVKSETESIEDEDQDTFLKKIENEVTPKVRNEKSNKKQIIRKRKLNSLKNAVEHAVRRRIDF